MGERLIEDLSCWFSLKLTHGTTQFGQVKPMIKVLIDMISGSRRTKKNWRLVEWKYVEEIPERQVETKVIEHTSCELLS
jgi:hypothetical protein